MLLPPDEVHVWCWRTDADVVADVLSSDERSRAARYRFARDRVRFTAARVMLRRVLGGYLAVAPERVSFTYSSFGKPSVAGVDFNLSHSGDLAVCAVSASFAVGIDIEQVRPMTDMESVFRTISSRDEQTEFQAFPTEQRPAAFFRCWTMKEACVKAHGTGLSTPLEAIQVLTPGGPPRFVDCNGLHCQLVPFVPEEGYTGALAFEQEADAACRSVVFHPEMLSTRETL